MDLFFSKIFIISRAGDSLQSLMFFLYAIPEIRAQRRHKEINDETVKIESIEREIKERDDIDSTRDIAPLKKAEDAYAIDVSYLAIDQVFEEILEKITI